MKEYDSGSITSHVGIFLPAQKL